MARKITLFSCKKSKKLYTQRQYIVVLGSMKYLRTDYWGVIEQLDLMHEFRHAFGLNQLPHLTTKYKFMHRDINAQCTIPVKERKGKRVHGHYGKHLERDFPENI